MELQLLQMRHANSNASRSLNAEGASLMSTSPASAGPAPPVAKPVSSRRDTDQAVLRPGAKWQSYATPMLVVILALAVLVTITRRWNAWEGGKVDQVTDDAYVRGDLTPLSTSALGFSTFLGQEHHHQRVVAGF